MGSYRVTGRPLNVNGKRHRVGAKVEFGDKEAELLIRLGRIKPPPPPKKPKPEDA